MNNNNLGNFQKLSQQNMEKVLKILGEWQEACRAISTEMADFTKRSFDDGAATIEKLIAAKSFDQAAAIHSDFARRSLDAYLHELSKIGDMYARLFKNSYDGSAHRGYS